HGVRASLLIAFVLVVMVIYVFLGRATDTLIPAVALPLSLLLTFAVMNMLGFSINNLTLMALTLAIGFLVDDAIVFLENVIRRAEHGESIVKAAYNTAGEISFTILSMTLSLAAVFILLVFLLVLLGCIIGLVFFFTHLPFTLLPVGDSGFARGVFIAQEGSSPAQMREFQQKVNQKIQAEPSVDKFFTLAGSGSRSSSSQAIIFCIFKPRDQRDPIEQCLLRLQRSISSIPGITAVISPSPVLQINVGATNQTQGQYAYTISGIVPQDVYGAANQMMTNLRGVKGSAPLRH